MTLTTYYDRLIHGINLMGEIEMLNSKEIAEIGEGSKTKNSIDRTARPLGRSLETTVILLCDQIDKLKDRVKELEKRQGCSCTCERME